jgi:hypothetical protein
MKKVAILLIAGIGLVPAISNADGPDETYTRYVESGEFEKAYQYISQFDDHESRYQQGIHLMVGSGVDKDECAAVSIFEQIQAEFPKSVRAISALNFIYNSSWAAMASIEGSASASFHLGGYYFSKLDQQYAYYIGDINYFAINSYINFKRAEKFGNLDSKKIIEILLEKYPYLRNVDIYYSKKVIKCPIRGQANNVRFN